MYCIPKLSLVKKPRDVTCLYLASFSYPFPYDLSSQSTSSFIASKTYSRWKGKIEKCRKERKKRKNPKRGTIKEGKHKTEEKRKSFGTEIFYTSGRPFLRSFVLISFQSYLNEEERAPSRCNNSSQAEFRSFTSHRSPRRPSS